MHELSRSREMWQERWIGKADRRVLAPRRPRSLEKPHTLCAEDGPHPMLDGLPLVDFAGRSDYATRASQKGCSCYSFG